MMVGRLKYQDQDVDILYQISIRHNQFNLIEINNGKKTKRSQVFETSYITPEDGAT